MTTLHRQSNSKPYTLRSPAAILPNGLLVGLKVRAGDQATGSSRQRHDRMTFDVLCQCVICAIQTGSIYMSSLCACRMGSSLPDPESSLYRHSSPFKYQRPRHLPLLLPMSQCQDHKRHKPPSPRSPYSPYSTQTHATPFYHSPHRTTDPTIPEKTMTTDLGISLTYGKTQPPRRSIRSHA